ncbi:hypothetical protein LXA43DRAFT_905393 [Ganoderma leucocontextum]|nr:hypothetical protein LXA43DRAFT_905393 [Ganoderma leucocontextum]
MPLLLAWRATCRDHYGDVATELRHSVLGLVSPFVPDPGALMSLTIRFGAIIIGEAALTYVLRDSNPTFVPSTLEISVGSIMFNSFMKDFRLLPGATAVIESINLIPHPTPFVCQRQIKQTAEIRLRSGRHILIRESVSISPCSPLAGSWTSALMNFVTFHSFGCAYPRLTLFRRGLLCGVRGDVSSSWDEEIAERMEVFSFKFGTSWSDLPPLEGTDRCPWVPGNDGCGRSIYVCPNQGRYFGDAGSLVVLNDVLNISTDFLFARRVAPYGTMVAWRLPSQGLCEGQCDNADELLPPEAVILLLRMMKGQTNTTNRYNTQRRRSLSL